MGILDRLSGADVMLDVSAPDSRSLLEHLAREAARRLGRREEEIFGALQAREKLGSTAVGNGVALPHAVLPGDEFPPTMLLARLARPVDFDARDGEPVDLVALILWPAAASKGLLDAMSEIARVLRDTGLLRRLRHSATAEEAAQLLRDAGRLDPA